MQSQQNKIVLGISFLLVIIIFGARHGYSQGFRGIVPLESTCDDVKRVFQVDHCTYPQSVYFLKEFWVKVDFVDAKVLLDQKWCFRVPAGRVSSFSISYNKRFPIDQFQYKLKYVEGPPDDIGTLTYESKEVGVSASTLNGEISTAFFGPTSHQLKELGYLCECLNTK